MTSAPRPCTRGRALAARTCTPKYQVVVSSSAAAGAINTTIALNASVLLVKAVPEPRAENSAFHLPAHHVTSPDTSRGETQHARLKSVQSQNAPSLFPCAKSLRRRISSQIGWLTQNSDSAFGLFRGAATCHMQCDRRRSRFRFGGANRAQPCRTSRAASDEKPSRGAPYRLEHLEHPWNTSGAEGVPAPTKPRLR